ncbi:DMT family transporter [Thermincola potens]|uniref:EamA domain-containing protein n=1 Tax=Thermincola potens (strain JR) TaxID=635013 RepID=D5XEI2_THEPJ|nr:DMT family transporter [Thermincola potens]ADG82053.1 protein of unknown function DUF6 transmembrane [Thermincola potens JR]
MTKKRFWPFAAITLVMIFWGLSFLSIKVSVAALGPMSLALSRFAIASLLLFTFLKIREPGTRLERKDTLLMAVSGIIGITVYFFFENNGVKLTTASTASIIIGTIPLLTILADFIFCGNRVTWSKGFGVAMSVIGVYLIVKESGDLSFASRHFIGNLMMFGAAFSWVFYSLLTRPLGQRYSRLAVTTYQTLFGTAAIVPFALFETNKWDALNWVVVGNVLFLGFFCSALGYYFYVYAMGELGVDISSLFINLIPVVTVVSSYFILGEKITSTQMIGGGIIVLAVYFADLSNWLKKDDRRKQTGQKTNPIENVKA